VEAGQGRPQFDRVPPRGEVEFHVAVLDGAEGEDPGLGVHGHGVSVAFFAIYLGKSGIRPQVAVVSRAPVPGRIDVRLAGETHDWGA
jgi:hypothetical protein